MRRGLVVWLVIALLAPALPLASASPPAGPSLPPGQVVDDAIDHLMAQQDDQGCIAGDPAATDWTVQAVVAAGRDPTSGDPSLVDGLRACPPQPGGLGSQANYVADLARHILSLVAAGQDPASFDGTDWVAELEDRFAAGQFRDSNHPSALNDDMFAILALLAAGQPTSDGQIQQAAGAIVDAQNGDGGWGITPSDDSMTDMTAAGLQALSRAQALPTAARSQAIGFLEAQATAREDGQATGCLGDGQHPGANPDSTAWAILGLLTVHRDPRAQPWGDHGGPWGCLVDHQRSDGSLHTTFTTPFALLALTGTPFGQATPALDRPTAQLSTSHPPEAGEPVDLVADGAAFAAWLTPDEQVLEGARAEWWPRQAGPASFQVLLLDPQGLASTASFTTDVQPADEEGGSDGSAGSGGQAPSNPHDERPVARAQLPEELERNVSASLEVLAAPADARIVAYRVDWGDGRRAGWSANPVFEHAYRALGEHTLQVYARDAEGDVSDPAQATVTVVDAAPRVEIEDPGPLPHGVPVQLTANAQDPDGPAPEVTWRLDGQEATGTPADLTLPTPGQHTVQATATDHRGQATHTTLTLTAGNRPPVLHHVEPRTAPPNTTRTLTLGASDPDGDRLEIAWQAPDQEAWGGQFHLTTGSPGPVPITVNVSDPYGAWTTTEVTVQVTEAADQEGSTQQPEPLTTRSSDQQAADGPAETPRARDPAKVELPDRVEGQAGVATLLEGTAHQPGANVTEVQVVLGYHLPVRGRAAFTALLPPLPEGTYEVEARAAGPQGQWGPWTNTTLVVTPPPPVPDEAEPENEALDPLSVVPNDEDPQATPLPALVSLAALLLTARWRRRR